MRKYKAVKIYIHTILNILLISIFFLTSCATFSKNGRTSPGTEEDYARLGLSKIKVEPWEDGMRTGGEKGTFEWWYFDAKLGDGSALVIVFYTKDILDLNKPLSPFITMKMTDKNGKVVTEKYYSAEAKNFSASKKQCDVKIGNNTFSGNLKDYDIHLDFDGLRADICLRGTTPAWRPALGHSFFIDDSGTKYFAWLPSVPQGMVKGIIEINGKTTEIAGSGYHDHNWGNASIAGLMHNWYWGRAEAGPYTVIASWITSTEKYGGKATPVFFLARDGQILAENGNFVTCTMKDVYTDEKSGKPVANMLIYDYDDGKDHYRVSFEREKDIENVKFADILTGFKKFLAKLSGFDGAYLRFSGRVTIEQIDGNKVIDAAAEQDAVWELMYPGRAFETDQ